MTGKGSALTLTATAAGTALAVEQAELTLDAGRAPFASLSLTVPYTTATATLLDPRNDVRIVGELRQGYTRSKTLADISAAFAGQTLAAITTAYSGLTLAAISAAFGAPLMGSTFRIDQTVRFDLGLRTRDVRVERGVIVVAATSDEAALTDYSLLSASTRTPGAFTVDAALAMVFAVALPGQAIDTSAVTGAPIATDAGVWQPGESAWSYLTSLLTPYGFRLWCDERRVWHVGPVDEFIIATPYDLSDTTNLKDVQDAVSRDLTWFDAVIVVYTWTDTSNVRHVAYDFASDGTPSKVQTVNVDRAYPGPGEAAARLRKVLTRGHQVSLDVSPDLTPYPSQFIGLALTSATPLAGYTEAITWTLPEDSMTLTASDIHEV